MSDVVGDCGDGGIYWLEAVVVTELQVQLSLTCVVGVSPWPEGLGLEGGGVLLEVWQGQEGWKQISNVEAMW
jgi:hypothetical protein